MTEQKPPFQCSADYPPHEAIELSIAEVQALQSVHAEMMKLQEAEANIAKSVIESRGSAWEGAQWRIKVDEQTKKTLLTTEPI